MLWELEWELDSDWQTDSRLLHRDRVENVNVTQA